jgi:hypothetical protein
MLSLTQIKKYATKVNFGKEPIIKFKKQKNDRSWVARVNNNPVVYINPTIKNEFEIRLLLYHELGHINTKSSCLCLNEYRAQMWAINRALSLGSNKIANFLLYEIEHGWIKLDWDSNQRRYIMASRLFLYRNRNLRYPIRKSLINCL